MHIASGMRYSVFLAGLLTRPSGPSRSRTRFSVSLVNIQRLEQDIMTMIGSFLDCSGATSTCLLEEAMLEEGASEGTCRLVGTLLELEHSRGRAVGHLLSGVITMDCNLKLLRRKALLPSLLLPQVVATEAYWSLPAAV